MLTALKSKFLSDATVFSRKERRLHEYFQGNLRDEKLKKEDEEKRDKLIFLPEKLHSVVDCHCCSGFICIPVFVVLQNKLSYTISQFCRRPNEEILL